MNDGHASSLPEGAWSYRTGTWFGVFGATATLLLPDSEKARVADLWATIDDGSSFDEVLDTLLQTGLGRLPGFALISASDGPVKMLIRGPMVSATVEAEGETVELDGGSASTWVERSFGQVDRLSVVIADAAPTDGSDTDFGTVGGLVRIARVDHPAPAAGPAGTAAPVAAPDVEVAVGADLAHDASAHESAPASDGSVSVAPVADAISADPDTILDSADEDGEDAGAASAESPEAEGQGDITGDGLPDEPPTEIPGATVPPPPPPPVVPSWGQPPSPPATPPAPPAAPAWQPPVADQSAQADQSDQGTEEPSPLDVESDTADVPNADPPPPSWGQAPDTAAGADHAEFEREHPGIPGQPRPPEITEPVAKLLISNGESVEVDRVVLIGRAPEARRFTATEQPKLVTVPSPLHEISSTHIEVRPGSGADHGTAVVTDMGSTNGTILVQPGLGPEDLKPGIAVQLIPGTTINLGDGVTIQVTRP